MKNRLIYTVLLVSFVTNITLGIFLVYPKLRRVIKKRAKKELKKEQPPANLEYHDGLRFLVVGKIHSENNFRRMPEKHRQLLRPNLWKLSNHSSGIQIRFKTNSPEIAVNWSFSENSNLSNITKLAANGLDLYCFVNGRWQYVNSAIPGKETSHSTFISNLDSTTKEFSVNLPLFSEATEVKIGIKKGYVISKGGILNKKTILFYGTSITQGSSASRPGMAYPAIVARKLNTETINFGFKGNGRFEHSIGSVICGTQPDLIIIDCTPNSPPDTIKKHTLKLILQLRECHPKIPILFVENVLSEYAFFNQVSSAYLQAQNRELKNAYNQAVNSGMGLLFYLDSKNLVGLDHEGVVDGVHPSDLGHLRIANRIVNKITTEIFPNDFKKTEYFAE